MARVKVLVKNKNGDIEKQIEFDEDMRSVRKALSSIEERQKKSAAERLKISDIAKRESTIERIDFFRHIRRKATTTGLGSAKLF